MRSTGEVMGLDRSFERRVRESAARRRHQAADAGAVFVSVREADKERVVEAVEAADRLGFKVVATHGTAAFPKRARHRRRSVNKVFEGRPHGVDAMRTAACSWCSTPPRARRRSSTRGRCAARHCSHKAPYYTTLAGALAAAEGGAPPIAPATWKCGRCRIISPEKANTAPTCQTSGAGCATVDG